MYAEAARVSARPAKVRAAVSNRNKLLAGVDGRGRVARRFRDVLYDLIAEFGGANALTTAELGLARQAAALTLRAESLQAAIVKGEPVSDDELIRTASEARRIMFALRRAKARKREPAAAPSLSEYLRSSPVDADGQ
jgi:hypothetical protein